MRTPPFSPHHGAVGTLRAGIGIGHIIQHTQSCAAFQTSSSSSTQAVRSSKQSTATSKLSAVLPTDRVPPIDPLEGEPDPLADIPAASHHHQTWLYCAGGVILGFDMVPELISARTVFFVAAGVCLCCLSAAPLCVCLRLSDTSRASSFCSVPLVCLLLFPCQRLTGKFR